MVYGGGILVNYYLVGDGVDAGLVDGVAEEAVSVLSRRYRYRIARAVCIGRAGDVDAVILLLIYIQGVMTEGFNRDCSGGLTAGDTHGQHQSKDKVSED